MKTIILFLLFLPLMGSSQSFFQRIFHPHNNQAQISDPDFNDNKKVLHFDDNSADTVQFQKSPPYVNQPASFTKVLVGDPSTDVNCTTRKVIVNAQSTSFMNAAYAQQAQHIFPGAIYQFKTFWDGSYQEVSALRNQIILSTDNPNMTNISWVSINDPAMNTIRDGIRILYSRFNNRVINVKDLRYQTYEYENKSDLSLRLSTGIGFPTFSIENSFQTKTKEDHHYITVDAIKELFTINAIKTNDSYFAQTVTNVENPIIISSVTYGIRILANLDIITKTKGEVVDFKAKYSGAISHGNIDFSYIANSNLNEQKINCYVIGGPGNSTVSFDKKEFETGIQNLIAGVTYESASPISYTLSDLHGNVIGTKSATDEIIEKECTTEDEINPITSVYFSIQTGEDNKNSETNYCVGLYQSHTYCHMTDVPCDGSGNDYLWQEKKDLIANYNNCKGDEYDDNSLVSNIPMTMISKEKGDYNGFKNGGELLLKRNYRNDKWKIQKAILIINFSNSESKTIVWDLQQNQKETTNVNNTLRFYFNDKYIPIDAELKN